MTAGFYWLSAAQTNKHCVEDHQPSIGHVERFNCEWSWTNCFGQWDSIHVC